ncbi:unnamed protein product [Fusarium graminearum]|nr:unnamed protein product [Fusarium graminearum]
MKSGRLASLKASLNATSCYSAVLNCNAMYSNSSWDEQATHRQKHEGHRRRGTGSRILETTQQKGAALRAGANPESVSLSSVRYCCGAVRSLVKNPSHYGYFASACHGLLPLLERWDQYGYSESLQIAADLALGFE